MGSPVVSPLINLVVRVFTIILILASLIVLISIDNISYRRLGFCYYDYIHQIKFTDIFAYRYMLSVMVIGLVWVLIQFVFTIYHVSSGNPGGNAFARIEFYGDKVISYLLGTGTAAGFGLTVDAKRYTTLDSLGVDFYNRSELILLLSFSLLPSCCLPFPLYFLPIISPRRLPPLNASLPSGK